MQGRQQGQVSNPWRVFTARCWAQLVCRAVALLGQAVLLPGWAEGVLSRFVECVKH